MDLTIPLEAVEIGIFALFALVAVAGALRVVTASDPFHSALSLLVVFVSLGVLYLVLEQPFVAIAQILVYAGAVVVLFLFVIAYLGGSRELDAGNAPKPIPGFLPMAVGTALIAAGVLVGVAWRTDVLGEPAELGATAAGYSFGSVQAVGEAFMVDYLLAFEMISIVLLVAMTGGVVLGLTGRARQKRMKLLMNLRSTDEQRRWYAEREAELRERRAADRGGSSEPLYLGADREEGDR